MTLSLFPTVGFDGVSANLKVWGSSEVSAERFQAGHWRFQGAFRLQNVSGMNLASNILLSLLGIWIWAYFPWNLRMNERTPFLILFQTWSWFQKSCCFDSGYSWRSKNIESFLHSELLLINSQIDMHDMHDVYIYIIRIYVRTYIIHWFSSSKMSLICSYMFFINLWMNRDWCCQAADDLGRAACRSIPRTLCSRDHTQSDLAGCHGNLTAPETMPHWRIFSRSEGYLDGASHETD